MSAALWMAEMIEALGANLDRLEMIDHIVKITTTQLMAIELAGRG